MLRRDLLKGWLAQNHCTLQKVANHLGITPRTLYSRMRKGDFRADEMERMIHYLHITNPSEVFFDFKEP